MVEEVDTCAVWFERWGRTGYALFDDEQGAAGFAVYLTEEGQGVPFGVQFPDGRALKVGEWPAFAERQRQWERADAARVVEPRPTRTVRDPFTDAVVDVEAGEPRWLGAATVQTTS